MSVVMLSMPYNGAWLVLTQISPFKQN